MSSSHAVQQTHLDLGVVGDRGLSVLAGYCDLKNTILVLVHRMRIAVPAVEVADKVGSKGIGRPLAIHDVAVWLHLEAKVLVALSGGQLWH